MNRRHSRSTGGDWVLLGWGVVGVGVVCVVCAEEHEVRVEQEEAVLEVEWTELLEEERGR